MTSDSATHIQEVIGMSCQCSRCNAEMEEGFLLEKGDGNVFSSQTWVSGLPEKSFFAGLSLKNRQVYDVKTFRCSACGYLDSYALKNDKPGVDL